MIDGLCFCFILYTFISERMNASYSAWLLVMLLPSSLMFSYGCSLSMVIWLSAYPLPGFPFDAPSEWMMIRIRIAPVLVAFSSQYTQCSHMVLNTLYHYK